MELTIEQALYQGVSAHREGRLQDAERFYQAILQSQPAHPDANHNLGILAMSVGKTDIALTLFKTALDANREAEQFWLSYIDALNKDHQFDNAIQVLDQARQHGIAPEKLNTLEANISLKSQESKTEKLGPPQEQLSILLEHYQSGRFNDAEAVARSISKDFPNHPFSWKVLGAVLGATGRTSEAVYANQATVALSPYDAEAHNNLSISLIAVGRLNEAEDSSNKAIELRPDYAEAHYILGNTLQALGRLDEARASYGRAIALNPDYAEAYSSLGVVLKQSGRLKEAIASYSHVIASRPDFHEAHYNLGIALQELGRLDEAEASYRKVIELKSEHAQAHNNLGNTLDELGRSDEAEACFRRAIALVPDYVEGHCNLGKTLQELGRLDDAEASYDQAIALNHNYAPAHYGLGKVFFLKGNEDLALNSFDIAHEIEPDSQNYQLMLQFSKARKSRKENRAAVGGTFNSALPGLDSNPLILNRAVEPKLIKSLYQMSSIQLDKTKRSGLLTARRADPRYGNGAVSATFNLFDSPNLIIQKVAKDLTKIMMEAVASDIYVFDSFFNILSAGGGGSVPHTHLSDLDRDIKLGIGEQKYSLVYYLSVGDQNAHDPGILKLYEPNEEILPHEGLILIIPASREHSAVYSGEADRVMIGVNFYRL